MEYNIIITRNRELVLFNLAPRVFAAAAAAPSSAVAVASVSMNRNEMRMSRSRAANISTDCFAVPAFDDFFFLPHLKLAEFWFVLPDSETIWWCFFFFCFLSFCKLVGCATNAHKIGLTHESWIKWKTIIILLFLNKYNIYEKNC